MCKLKLIVLVASFFMAGATFSATNTINPMSPRQLSVQKANADYTYGYSLLPGNAIDSLERANRVGFYINYEILDRYIVRPVAHGYAKLPSFIHTGVDNFTSNIEDATSVVDNLLVLRAKDSSLSLSRFLINSTLGIAGFIDVASGFGIDKHQMSLATVLGIWGQDQGPYLMIPLYGQTTARQLQGDLIDAEPFYFIPFWATFSLWALDGINTRAKFIEQEGLIDNAIDPYIQSRDIFLMYSEGLVNPEDNGSSVNLEGVDESYLDEIDG